MTPSVEPQICGGEALAMAQLATVSTLLLALDWENAERFLRGRGAAGRGQPDRR